MVQPVGPTYHYHKPDTFPDRETLLKVAPEEIQKYGTPASVSSVPTVDQVVSRIMEIRTESIK